jgi:hypothetical protein
MDTSSFDWFTLENKVRTLFLELLEPITLRFADQKQLDDTLQEAIQTHKHIMEGHDLTFERLTRKTQHIDDLSRRLAAFENSQRVLDSKMSLELSSLQSQLDSFSSSSIEVTASLRSFDTRIDMLTKASKTSSSELIEIKTKVLEKLQELRQKVDNEIRGCLDEIKSYDGIFKEANHNYESLSSSIVSVDIKAMSCVQELTFLKLDLQRMKKDDLVKERITRVEESIMKTRQIMANDLSEHDKLIKRLTTHVESVQPLRTQLQISEVLHMSLTGPMKKALVEYEMQKFAELSTSPECLEFKERLEEAQQRAVEVHETIVKEEQQERAASALQRPSSRNLHARRPRRTNTNFAGRSLSPSKTLQDSDDQMLEKLAYHRPKMPTLTLSFDEENLASNEQEDEEEYSDYDEPYEELDLASFRTGILEEVRTDTDEIKDRLTRLTDALVVLNEKLAEANHLSEDVGEKASAQIAELTLKGQETSAYFESMVKQALDKGDSANTQRRRDHSDVLKELHKVFSEIENVTQDQSKLWAYTKTVGKMTTGVVEFCKITKALLTQDEEDRESIALMGYKEGKESARPKAKVVALDKQCLSCSSQSPIVVSAFKMACIAYAPTPISYMKQTYTRKELIEIQGQLLQSSWDKVSAYFKLDSEILQDEVERLSTLISRVSTTAPRPRSRNRSVVTPSPNITTRTVGAMTRAQHSPNILDFHDEGLPFLSIRRKRANLSEQL